MLSEQDKKDMLADAHSPERREAFRRMKAVGAGRPVSFSEYATFVQAMNTLFPPKPPAAPSQSARYLL
jgi:hypothetical protein